MKTRIMKIVIALAVLIALPVSAIEIDLSEIGFPVETVDMHGFFSQGYMKSTNNNYFGESRDGTVDLREFGLNFSGYLTDDILLAVQGIGYSLGEQGGDKIKLHYGIIDYKMSDVFGIRGGRIRVPVGLYNETRDIDMLRSSVFLPQSIYPEQFRDYYASADAVAIYGGVDMNNLGDMSYQLYSGKLVNDDDPLSDLPFYFEGLGLTNNRFENGRTSGAQLLWNTPYEGLRFGWTYRRIDNTAYVGGLGDFELTVNNLANQVWSAEYQVGKLTVMSEYGYIRTDSAPTDTSWYAGANYDLTDKVSVGGAYSNYSAERSSGNSDPDSLSGYEKTVSLYGKYNITDSWLVKAQVDMRRGSARQQPSVADAGDQIESTLFSIKTSWSF